MANGDKSFKQLVTEILTFVASIVASIGGIAGAISKVGGPRVLPIIIAVLGLSFFIFILYRRIQRARERRHQIQVDKTPRDTGFNEALPYTAGDAHRFYGRLNDTSLVLKQIGREGYGLGVMHGESGVGKTSLVQAGLIPQLRKNNILCASLAMNCLPTDTGTAAGILEFIAREIGPAFQLQDCRDLEEIAGRLADHPAAYAVVFLDQFEQVFDQVNEGVRQELAQDLEAFCRGQRRLKLAVIVREEYFGRVHHMFRELERNSIYYLYKFNQAQAREVIRNSMGSAGDSEETQPGEPLLEFEDAVLEDLVDRDQRIHPVELSLICSTMIKVNGKLDRRDYLEGGKKQGWLNRYLEDVLKGLPHKEALRVLSSLIQRDKAATLTVREVSERSGVSQAETQRLLKDFRQSRLVVTEEAPGETADTAVPDIPIVPDEKGRGQGETKYRLSHEYLIASIRLRCGDVETPVQKYSRLLDTRAAAWERENRSSLYLLKGKSLLDIRYRYRKHLGWDQDPLKKALVCKSLTRFITRWAISAAVVAFMVIGIFFTMHLIMEKEKRVQYLSLLKNKSQADLRNIETDLLRLAGEDIDLKLQILKGVLLDENKCYYDGIMPVLLHTLIGVSVESRDKVLDKALTHIKAGNIIKLKWLFTKEYSDPAHLSRFQQELLRFLKTSKDPGNKNIICEALANIGDDQAVPFLIRLLKGQDEYDRSIATFALGGIVNKNERAIPSLIRLLNDPSPEVRSSAAMALGNISLKSETLVPSLIPLLKDPKNYVRSSTAGALGRIGIKSEPAVPFLIPLLKDHNAYVRLRAAGALGNIGRQSEPVVPFLISLLNDPIKYVRLSAAEALGNIGRQSEPAIPVLIKLLKDPESNIRSGAATALGNIGRINSSVLPSLIPLLKDPINYVRSSAARVLGNIGSTSAPAIPSLIPLLKDPENYVRSSAAYALGKIGSASEPAIPLLIQLLKDTDGNIRRIAADALGNIVIRSEPAVPSLIQLLNDPNSYVRRNAAEVLGNIAHTGAAAVPSLIDLVKNSKEEVRTIVIQNLGKIEPGTLSELIINQDTEVLCSASWALGKIGAPAAPAVPLLKEIFKNEENYQAKFYLLQALMRIDPTNKKNYLALLIEEVLPHPLLVGVIPSIIKGVGIKQNILEIVGEVAAQDAEGKKVVGKNHDFDQNMWTMLEWWNQYKKRQK